uniref:Uncharacterized protein n=1 Tax=Arundo donax TaxID=35708 RepID=A0A0A9UCN8_ARUDO
MSLARALETLVAVLLAGSLGSRVRCCLHWRTYRSEHLGTFCFCSHVLNTKLASINKHLINDQCTVLVISHMLP